MSVAGEDFILPVKISTKFQLCVQHGIYFSAVGARVAWVSFTSRLS
jgi:hypothetical protein